MLLLCAAGDCNNSSDGSMRKICGKVVRIFNEGEKSRHYAGKQTTKQRKLIKDKKKAMREREKNRQQEKNKYENTVNNPKRKTDRQTHRKKEDRQTERKTNYS